MEHFNYCGLTGRVVVPCSPDYDVLRQEWNRAIQKFPCIIVYCYSNLDVSNAVVWSRKNSYHLRIRSGGHNYEGYSTGDHVLVIDISQMNKIIISEDETLVTVGAGAQNIQVYNKLSEHGFAFAGGGCPTVCEGGFVSGGGIGLATRYLGLGCDSLTQLEIINYEGKLIKASQSLNSDLFWACRGAGGSNFGVIVSYTFSLTNPRQKVDYVSLITFEWENNLDTSVEYLKRWQRWLINLDERITVESSLYLSNGSGRGFFFGSEEEAREIISPLISLEGVNYKIAYMSYIEAVRIVAYGFPRSEKFQSTGRFVGEPLSDNTITTLVNALQSPPVGSVYSAYTVYALGGVMSNKSPTDTAFFYRYSPFILGVQSAWEDDSYATINKEWVKTQFDYIEPLTIGSYVNFPYSEIKDYLTAYYGENVPRLKQVKYKYDPYNVFTYPQGIRY